MSDDLYTRWLDVPPGERPPAPHVLLNLPKDVSDRQQIEEAAHRQLQTLDQYAAHRDPRVRQACAQMMNEVACARNLLIGWLAPPVPASTAAVTREDFRKALARTATDKATAVGSGGPSRISTAERQRASHTSDPHNSKHAKEHSSFDPYHRWLGISSQEQPPDHYRLLGVERFESESDVIQAAADRQMLHVRNYQLGEHAAFCQQVLNELAAASACLLNPQKKARYDEQLRQRLLTQAPVAPAANPIPTPPIPPSTPTGGAPEIRTRLDGQQISRRKRSRWRSFSFVLGLLTSVALFALIGWLAVGSESTEEKQEPEPVAVHSTRGAGEDSQPPSSAPPTEPGPATASSQSNHVTSDSLWLDARTETANVGPVNVRVDSVQLDRPRVLLDTERMITWSRELLLVTLELTNTDAAQTTVHLGWGGGTPRANQAVLYDNHSTSYRTVIFSQGRVEGQQNDVNLSDEPLREVLVFERPDEDVEFLRLLLPASAFGQEGTIRFHIPSDMIGLEADEREAESRLAAAETEDPNGQTAQTEAVDPAESSRTPVPDHSEQQAIRRVLDEVYDTTADRDPEEKRELADQLTDLVEEAENAAERFVLLRRASELASEGGDAMQMLQYVDRIADEFEVDRLAAQAFMLRGFAQQATGEDQLRALVGATSHVIDRALEAEQFDLAAPLAETVYRACLVPAGRPLRHESLELRREVQGLRDTWNEVQAAREELESNPDDEVAHTILAGWYYFVRDDWDRALPHFAKGFEPELKDLAKRELNDPPTDAAAQVDLADAWWDFSQQGDADSSPVGSARAAYWYEKAWPGLSSPLVRAKVRQRLKELGTSVPDLPSESREANTLPPGQRGLGDLLEEAETAAPQPQTPVDREQDVPDEGVHEEAVIAAGDSFPTLTSILAAHLEDSSVNFDSEPTVFSVEQIRQQVRRSPDARFTSLAECRSISPSIRGNRGRFSINFRPDDNQVKIGTHTFDISMRLELYADLAIAEKIQSEIERVLQPGTVYELDGVIRSVSLPHFSPFRPDRPIAVWVYIKDWTVGDELRERDLLEMGATRER